MAADRSHDYEGELVGNILLEDGEDVGQSIRSNYGGYGGGHPPPFIGGQHFFGADRDDRPELSLSPGGGVSSSGSRGMQRTSGGEAPNRTPTRTPSPVYQWNNPKKVSISEEPEARQATTHSESSQATAPALSAPTPSSAGASEALPYSQMPLPFLNPYFSGTGFNAQAQAYYGLMMQNSLMNPQAGNLPPGVPPQNPPTQNAGGGTQGTAAASQGSSSGGHAESKPTGPQGPPLEYIQMIMAMQAMQVQGSASAGGAGKGQSSPSTNSSAAAIAPVIPPAFAGNATATSSGEPRRGVAAPPFNGNTAAVSSGEPNRGGAAVLGNASASAPASEEKGKRSKNRGGGKDAVAMAQRNPPAEAAVPKERGGKGERRKRGSGGSAVAGNEIAEFLEQPKGGGKSSKPANSLNNPIIEQLKTRDRNVELSELTHQIADIAQDQYGSRLIQQKLEVASDEEKQRAFKAILQKMPQLTIDVFGNYVIQKFFEYGNAEQRRILAEQLVGQVLKLSHQMYGCRVVQKALDSVPIEQQVLLIGELKGHVLTCIEDQHGNHVIQKCIERLPTDKINFIVDSFDGQATRMAKHCYGCRVIQRLIEYCSSQQISNLLDEVLRNCMELATDQYGNYVVQHVMEHSSRKGDREAILAIVRKNINLLSCHKYASNSVEKALQCGTYEERASIVNAIVGAPEDNHPPLMNMMRDRFGNYIVQRTIALAQSPQREALLWKLQEQMPQLKKSNTYGKHIITALEKAQAQLPPS